VKSDAELIAASGHDPDAFRQLYDRHAGPVHGFLLRRTRDPDAAMDLTAETFAQAWSSRHRFSDQKDGSAAGWVFGIARNVLSRSARERRMVRAATDALGLVRPESEAMPDDSWMEGLEADLERALADLPESQRQAVELRILADQPYQAVADQLDCSPTAARIRVSRGLSHMRRSLNVVPSTKEI
jgi:RNA polymerase sigma-70 factor (ECF subfamily)